MIEQLMDFLKQLMDALIHLSPTSINTFVEAVGPGLSYTALFLIIFAETGLVITPILPGDSLLFAIGVVTAHPSSPIGVEVTALLLVVAAVLGDAINYSIGYFVGPRVFAREDSRLLNKKHLIRAHAFYEKYGGVTIILARFVPIVRTFAPFVAGIGRMNYPRFAVYNIAGGTAWVLVFVFAGRWFAQLPVVQNYFHLVIAAIIVISVIPGVVEYVHGRRRR